jgi:uncharacterized membrane protein YesL
MAQQKKGLITRLLEGKEKSEDYARSTLPTNRWQLFWDVFKGNFSKIVKVNLLILLFFLPLLAFIIVNNMIVENNGYIYPFSANMGIGYPGVPEQAGISELLVMQNSVTFYLGIIVCSTIAAVGLAGGMYVIRNMVWTEGIFVANDFWRGIRLNFKNALQVALIFTITLFLSGTMIASAEFNLATETGTKWLMIASEVVSYILIIVVTMMCFWMVSLGVNYKLTFLQMIRNSFILTVGTLVQTVFFIAAALLPFLLFLLDGQFFTIAAFIVIILFGLSYALLVWINFSQWAFDQFINPKLAGAKVGRGIYNKDGSSALTGDDSEAKIEYQRVILAHGKSRLMAKPIKPIDDSLQVYELPQSFSREDLKKLRESKQSIAEDTAAYAEEHKNDLRYVEYNKQFEERERALQDEDSKKKKRKPPKLLGQ